MDIDEETVRRVATVSAQRAAYVDARVDAVRGTVSKRQRAAFHRAAVSRYPMPTTPRVELDPLGSRKHWRVCNGSLEMSGSHATWLRWGDFHASPEAAPLRDRVLLWADLYTNPNAAVSNVG